MKIRKNYELDQYYNDQMDNVIGGDYITMTKKDSAARCPHCDVPLVGRMIDVDGTNLIERDVCPECGYGTPSLM